MPLAAQLTAWLLAACCRVPAAGQTCGAEGPLHQPPVAFWAGKNGDLQRSGVSPHGGPQSLDRVAWSFQDPVGYGAIEASPVIDGNYTSFIATTAGGLFALWRDGSVAWSQRLPGRVMTPALAKGVLYVGTSAGIGLAFDAASGRELWRKQLAAHSGFDSWVVTATGDAVILPALSPARVPDGPTGQDGNYEIIALEPADGAERWRRSLLVPSYNFMPAVVGGDLLFMDREGAILRIRLTDGSTVYNTPGVPGSFCTGGLVVAPGGLIIATSNLHPQGDLDNNNGHVGGLVSAYRLEDGELVWRQQFNVEAAAAPAVVDLGQEGAAVVVGTGDNCAAVRTFRHDGEAVALRAATGERIWGFTPPTHVGIEAKGVEETFRPDHMEAGSLPDTWTNPAVDANCTVYVGWHGGIVYALDGRSGQPRSLYDVGSSFQGEPAIAPRYLVVPSITRVVAFDTGLPGFAEV